MFQVICGCFKGGDPLITIKRRYLSIIVVPCCSNVCFIDQQFESENLAECSDTYFGNIIRLTVIVINLVRYKVFF